MSNQIHETSNLGFSILKLVGVVASYFFISITIPVAIYCAQIHIWPEHSRFGDAEMRMAAVTMFFIFVSPLAVVGGNTLIWFCTKWLLVRLIGWILSIPVLGTFLVLFGKLAGLV